MSKKLVSIITPSYNSSNFIADTILSIQRQSYINWELLITDDCSTDNTIQIINSFVQKDKRIKLFKFNENKGAGFARNNSISHAKGTLIAFCDSDDIWLPKKLEKQIIFMKKKNLVFTYSSYNVCNSNNENIGLVRCPKKISFRKMLNNNYVGCLTAIYDSEKLGKLFMSKIRNRQDWVLWLKILKVSGPTLGIEEPLAVYRKRNNSISSSKLKQLIFNYNVYRKELGFNFLLSLILMVNFMIYYAAKKI